MSTRCQIEFYHGGQPGEFGEPAARVYKHSDGYPSNILPLLRDLERKLGKQDVMYGQRVDDPEYAAADFVCRYRLPHGTPVDKSSGALPHYRVGQTDNTHAGNIYITHGIHGDIEFLYRVVCNKKWEISIFSPLYDEKYDIKSFDDVTSQYTSTGKELK